MKPIRRASESKVAVISQVQPAELTGFRNPFCWEKAPNLFSLILHEKSSRKL